MTELKPANCFSVEWRFPFTLISLMCALLVCGGCRRAAYEYDAVVTGTVTIDGELAKSGIVTFHPVNEGKPAIGRIHSDGSYSLRTGQGVLHEVDGGTVVPGEYLVTASITAPPAEGHVVAEGGPPIPGPSLIASKYAQKNTTDLRVTVKPGSQVIVLDLERAEPEPAEGEEETADAVAAENDDATDQESRTGEVDPTSSAGLPASAESDDRAEAAQPDGPEPGATDATEDPADPLEQVENPEKKEP